MNNHRRRGRYRAVVARKTRLIHGVHRCDRRISICLSPGRVRGQSDYTYEPCLWCWSNGYIDEGADYYDCPACNGYGYLVRDLA